MAFNTLLADPWADEVVTVEYGAGAGFGQEYFPDNVLGSPDSSASPGVPSTDPAELLTLGSAGVIVLTFLDGGIIDEEGPDFTVFENPFYFGNPPQSYAETGIVAASEDGEEWFEFPYNLETLAGLAGVTPTDGSADPLDPATSGGDAFDLADVGLERAVYIRITDSEGLVQDSGPSFDLDAVAAVHGEDGERVDREIVFNLPDKFTVSAYPNPFNSSVTLCWNGSRAGRFSIKIMDVLGRLILENEISGSKWSWTADGCSSGVYYIMVTGEFSQSATNCVLLLR